jgi:bifunctional DNA-binding transcriptional regulator/antitoxin component of YhaV-PrlF toxin-antitoxin module
MKVEMGAGSLSSSGQCWIPINVVKHLRLKSGDEIVFFAEDCGIVIEKKEA